MSSERANRCRGLGTVLFERKIGKLSRPVQKIYIRLEIERKRSETATKSFSDLPSPDQLISALRAS
jgi:hypothetical protein